MGNVVSKINSTGLVFVVLGWFWKFCSHCMKRSVFIYPVSDIKGRVPAGASEHSSWLILRGNIVTGGTYMSEAQKQHTTVTSCPRSADTILATILSLSLSYFPLPAVTLGNLLGEVLMPLSSMLKILFGGKLCFSNTARKLSKNLVT